MVAAAFGRLLRDRRRHAVRPHGRAARRDRTVHQPGLLVLPARRQAHRRTREGSLAHRDQPADRLLGLSRLEGHAGDSRSPRASAPIRTCAATARSTRRRSWSTASAQCSAATSRRSKARSTRPRARPRRAVGAGHDVARPASRSTSRSAAARCGVDQGEVWLCPVTKAVPVTIGRGENRGHKITYHNVVRRWLKLGDWNGRAGSWTVPLENITARRRRCRGGLCAGRQPRQAGRDARRGLTSLH